MNPASFSNPSIGQTPSGVGPGAIGVDRNVPNDRRQNLQRQQHEPQSTFSNLAIAARPVSGPVTAQFTNDHGTTALTQPAAYSYNYAALNNAPRPVTAAIPNVDPYANAFYTSDYTQRSRGGFPTPQSVAPQHEQPISPLTDQNDWMATFNNLSLNGNGR